MLFNLGLCRKLFIRIVYWRLSTPAQYVNYFTYCIILQSEAFCLSLIPESPNNIVKHHNFKLFGNISATAFQNSLCIHLLCTDFVKYRAFLFVKVVDFVMKC